MKLRFVAPITGAWIETLAFPSLITGPRVAPITGAWIETPKHDVAAS